MSAIPRLREFLDRHGVRYQVLARPPSGPAAEAARPGRRPGQEIAKVVVIRHGGGLSLAVLPARFAVDLERLGAALREEIVPASEAEIAAAFPDCAMGAVPPFGVLFGLRTYLDASLTHGRQIAFDSGTHHEVIRMPFEDYRRIAAPIVLWFSGSFAHADG